MISTVRRVWQGISWYVGTIMGDRAYARYIAHLQATHPGSPLPTEREFWRMRHAEADTKPGMRCC